MIWLTWRLHRKLALYTAIALVAIAAVMLPTGIAMHHAFTHSGLASCLAKLGDAQVIQNDGCTALQMKFSSRFSGLIPVAVLFVVLPVLIGLFFGAPLIGREVEQGTHRLVWTQGVSRRRWATSTFALIGAVVLLLAIAYAAGMSWWMGPLIATDGARIQPVSFDVEGIVPVAYTLFAVALGIWLGTLTRRVLPAMGITLAGYALVRILVEALARPRYASPVGVSMPVSGNAQLNPAAGDWTLSQGVINGAGKLVSNGQIGCSGPSAACDAGLSGNGFGAGPFSNWASIQPGTRFWAFQGIETGIFLALTALLIFFALRQIRRIA